MRNQLTISLLVVMTVCSTLLFACASMQSQNDLNITRSNTVTTTATVEQINLEDRSVRMRSALGHTITVHAGNEVYNLDKIKAGDVVAVEYYESLAVRMAKPDEVRAESMEITKGSEGGKAPAGVAGRQVTITADILAINKKDGTVTLKGPDGTIVTAEVRQPEHLDKVRVGDTIVMTYTQAVAMSIQKIVK